MKYFKLLLILLLYFKCASVISSSTWLNYFVYCERTMDFNQDGWINGADLGALLAYWGQPCGDLTYDNTTDGADLSLFLSRYNTPVVFTMSSHHSGDGRTLVFDEFTKSSPSPFGVEYIRYWYGRYFKLTLYGAELRYQFVTDEDIGGTDVGRLDKTP